MTTEIRIGDKARTVCPLKPTGQVLVRDRTIDAASDEGWVDADTEVQIIGGTARRAIVRSSSTGETVVARQGELLPEEVAYETTPLESPPAWVERIPAVLIGIVIGVGVIPLVWLSGTPLTVFAALVPVAGAISGWLFRAYVGAAIGSVGPREDHRPRAVGIAGAVFSFSASGAAIGLAEGGFLGLSCGLMAGALLGGLLAYLWLFFFV